jgi:hypothetical protein
MQRWRNGLAWACWLSALVLAIWCLHEETRYARRLWRVVDTATLVAISYVELASAEALSLLPNSNSVPSLTADLNSKCILTFTIHVNDSFVIIDPNKAY